MIWLVVFLCVALVVALVWWWLSRPLWYRASGVRELENFLRDLVSPRSPWPNMLVVSRKGSCRLRFSRRREEDGAFQLDLAVPFESSQEQLARSLATELRASHFSRDQIAIATESNGSLDLRIRFGRSDVSVLAEATQASRMILKQLGVREDEALHVRYAGAMDSAIGVPALQNVEREAGRLMRFAAKVGLRRFNRS